MKDLYTVYMLCVECKKIYKLNFVNNFLLGVTLIFMSIPNMIFVISKDPGNLNDKYIYISVFFIMFILGIIILSDILRKERNCKVCNGKNTLIKLDTPEAIEIIKENDLSFPDESPEEDKFPWETKS